MLFVFPPADKGLHKIFEKIDGCGFLDKEPPSPPSPDEEDEEEEIVKVN